MYFGFSPTAGAIIAIILIGYLIATGIRSVSNSTPSVDPDFDRKYKEFMDNMGPMTWKERIVGALLIILFVALVAWVSSMI